jgi:DNA-3-methyladenine glycosylase II
MAVRHLWTADLVLRHVIDAVGPFTLRPQRRRFATLARAIVAQQISTSAARTIWLRLNTLAGARGVTAESISQLSQDQLRTVGVSQQKATYLHDLAQHALDGRVRFDRHRRMTDDQIIEELIQVKGVGRWTAQMFLIFSLGRMDVFPHDDLGVRNAIRNLYGLSELPNRETCLQIGQPWRPYSSVASWYCWRSLELATAKPAVPA